MRVRHRQGRLSDEHEAQRLLVFEVQTRHLKVANKPDYWRSHPVLLDRGPKDNVKEASRGGFGRAERIVDFVNLSLLQQHKVYGGQKLL